LKANGTMSGAEIGACIAIGLDRRTGQVYEGINGLPTDVIPEDALQGTLHDNYDAMAPSFPFAKEGTRPAPFCAACNQVLDGVESATGRYKLWPPSKGSKR